jgi:hypothetical protein
MAAKRLVRPAINARGEKSANGTSWTKQTVFRGPTSPEVCGFRGVGAHHWVPVNGFHRKHRRANRRTLAPRGRAGSAAAPNGSRIGNTRSSLRIGRGRSWREPSTWSFNRGTNGSSSISRRAVPTEASIGGRSKFMQRPSRRGPFAQSCLRLPNDFFLQHTESPARRAFSFILPGTGAPTVRREPGTGPQKDLRELSDDSARFSTSKNVNLSAVGRTQIFSPRGDSPDACGLEVEIRESQECAI